MNPSELAKNCVSCGFIPETLEAKASLAIAKAFEKKGESQVIEKLEFRMRRSPIYSINTLKAILDELPDEPTKQTEPMTDEAKSVPDEIHDEIIDRNEIEFLRKKFPTFFCQEWTEPNDPRFEAKNSIFTGPYSGLDKYKSNTYISVKREAEAERTSMHEICRRKDLRYECLIW